MANTLPNDGLTLRSVRTFVFWTFALTWSITGVAVIFRDQVEAVFGPIGYTNPLFILAVYAPGIVAIVLLLWQRGMRGLVTFFSRLAPGRMSMRWWAVLLLGVPSCFFVGAALKGTLSSPLWQASIGVVVAGLAKALFIGPIEEIGWRGLALPVLQRTYSPIAAALILGTVWALWHIPAFFMSGTPQASWSFPAFFVAVVALSVIVTPMVNAARGSLLIAALFHAQVNSPLWPDAQPWDTFVFVALAVAVVLANRHVLFQPGAGATVVFGMSEPPASGDVRHPEPLEPTDDEYVRSSELAFNDAAPRHAVRD